jgi:hypothetical protein
VVLATPGTTLGVIFDTVVGHKVFFSTEQALVSTDTDTNLDVYAWEDGVVALMTPSSPYDVFFDATARDGEMVIGTTTDVPLGKLRIYRYTATTAQPVNETTGQSDATYAAVSADGDHVAFETGEDYPGGDSDGHAIDVIVAQFPAGPGAPAMAEVSSGTNQGVHYAGASASLDTIFFETDEAVVPEDHNAATDVYSEEPPWGGPGHKLVTDGTGGPDRFEAVAANGLGVIFSTSDADAASDTDGLPDLYYSEGVGFGLMSGGTTAGAVFTGASADVKTVVYTTSASAAAADTDSALDVYSHTLDVPGDVLVSGGTADQDASPNFVAPDASSVVFSTQESLSAADTDTANDIYRSATGGVVTLLSGQGTTNVFSAGAAANGTIYFGEGQDVFANEAGVITSISVGTPVGDKSYEGASADGSLVAFSSTARLTTTDSDDLQDIYAFGSFTPPAGPPVDTTAPTGTAHAKKQKNDGRVEVTVSCSEPCTATPSGTLVVPVLHAKGSKKFKLRGKAVQLAGGEGTVTLTVPKKAKKAAAAALKAGRKVQAKVIVTIVDAAANTGTLTTKVKFKK